jgi:hypothetical protein
MVNKEMAIQEMGEYDVQHQIEVGIVVTDEVGDSKPEKNKTMNLKMDKCADKEAANTMQGEKVMHNLKQHQMESGIDNDGEDQRIPAGKMDATTTATSSSIEAEAEVDVKVCAKLKIKECKMVWYDISQADRDLDQRSPSRHRTKAPSWADETDAERLSASMQMTQVKSTATEQTTKSLVELDDNEKVVSDVEYEDYETAENRVGEGPFRFRNDTDLFRWYSTLG